MESKKVSDLLDANAVKRKRKVTTIAAYDEAAKQLGLMPGSLAELIGYPSGAYGFWRAKQAVPLVAQYAVERVLLNQSQATERLMIVRSTDEDMLRMIERIVRQFGATVAFVW